MRREQCLGLYDIGRSLYLFGYFLDVFGYKVGLLEHSFLAIDYESSPKELSCYTAAFLRIVEVRELHSFFVVEGPSSYDLIVELLFVVVHYPSVLVISIVELLVNVQLVTTPK